MTAKPQVKGIREMSDGGVRLTIPAATNPSHHLEMGQPDNLCPLMQDIFCTLACNLTKSSVTVRLKEPWAVPNPLLTRVCFAGDVRPGSPVRLGFPPGGQRPDAQSSPRPAQLFQRGREAVGGPRDLPWRRARRECRRRLSPPVLPTSRPAAAAAVATPRTGRPPHLSSGQWRSLPPPTPARRRPGRAAQAAGSGSSRRSASG
ncbi:hypothetical protein DBR06_SOUSAS20510022 [Sousa chinensis]|uniref:Uncharacterized protein n=1 Tax=Sousa chinensis TaxID=103600 RepID=A0A484GIA1_SOUCH|nr:hypothetical protein DBR06_SOUSAS20510022 [Sousa chinensis]